ncbi:DUF397 domain-containing protein [Streptomyces sp. NPDC048290]|uniref:DUF397 domain-containing protein n=1 Tax=Streptomyces sp. NPDC048290 TaxID=3155811 RepID=UPI00342628A7
MIHAHIPEADWRSSTYSQGNGGECVQWASAYAHAHQVVPVRDSKISDGPTLAFPAAPWSSFIAALKGNHLSD